MKIAFHPVTALLPGETRLLRGALQMERQAPAFGALSLQADGMASP